MRTHPKGLAVVLAFAVASLGFAQTKIDSSNYKQFFDRLEKKKAYIEGASKSLFDEKPVFLGNITKNKYATDSLANKYSTHGSKYGLDTIFSKYGDYGSKYSSKSAFNKYATEPPELLYKEGGKVYIAGYLTKNKYHVGDHVVPKIDPLYLFLWLGREDDLPDNFSGTFAIASGIDTILPTPDMGRNCVRCL